MNTEEFKNLRLSKKGPLLLKESYYDKCIIPHSPGGRDPDRYILLPPRLITVPLPKWSVSTMKQA